MKQSTSIASLATALVKAQAELQPIGKDATNPHFRSKFASLDNIIEKVRPILAKHGLAIVQGSTTPESDAESKLTGFTVETVLVHSSGEWLSSGVVIPLAKADPQGAGAALTYGRRYGLSAFLSLATDEDDDGNTAVQRSGVNRGTGGAPRGATASVGQQAASETRSLATTQLSENPEGYVMPIGKSKGKMLGEIATDDLGSAVEWIREKSFEKKYADLILAIGQVLAKRELDLEVIGA